MMPPLSYDELAALLVATQEQWRALTRRVAVLEKALRDLRDCFKWDAPGFVFPYLEVETFNLRDPFPVEGFVNKRTFDAIRAADAALGEPMPEEEPVG